MKPHPFGEELENMILFVYRKQMLTEASILRTILGDLFADGLSPREIIDAHNDFIASAPPTYGMAYYRAAIRKHAAASRCITTTTNVGVNDAW